jgi:hypothetical protein
VRRALIVCLLAATLCAATAASAEEESGPSLDQILPRIYDSAYAILGLTFAVLALGFVLLYRMDAASAATKPKSRPGR